MSPKDKKMLILKELEEKKELLRDYLVAGHRKPKTRREFLASGLLSAATTLVAPTLSQLVASSAWAQSGVVCPSGAGDFPIFVHLQLAGGPALYANHLVCGPDGGNFSNYGRLGMGSQPERAPRFSSSAPIWVSGVGSKGSPMFNQAFSVLNNDQDIISNSAFVSIAAASVDDTTNDKQDMTGILQQAGAIGAPLPYLLTTGNIGETISVDRVGALARFKGAIYEEANLLSVVNLTSIENGLGYGLAGALGSFPGSAAQKLTVHQTLTKLIEDLNKYQVEQIAREPNSHASQKIFKSMLQCASEKNTANSTLSNNIIDIYDPNYPGGTALAQVFARNRSGEMNRVIGNVGQMMGACLSGLSNSAIITLGGYDYHNGRTRAQADEKDQFAGDILGRILLSAKRMNKKVFVFVSADGSVSVPRNISAGENVNWQGDLAQRGMAYMIAYDPNKVVDTEGFSLGSYSDAAFQLNHFVNDGGDYRVSSVNPIASLDANELFTSAVFLNYLNFAGQQSLIDAPKMSLVKEKLVKSLPGGTIFNYYTRIKG